MRKNLFFVAICFTIFFTACTKDNSTQPTSATAKKLADDGNKQDIGQADGNKQDIGQADGN
jgi:ABC-type enterochelin transport system substrate-binding protein